MATERDGSRHALPKPPPCGVCGRALRRRPLELFEVHPGEWIVMAEFVCAGHTRWGRWSSADLPALAAPTEETQPHA